jgi:hypothetical protein
MGKTYNFCSNKLPHRSLFDIVEVTPKRHTSSDTEIIQKGPAELQAPQAICNIHVTKRNNL